jgi:ATP-binding cassette subfamily F protein uup
VQRLNTRFAEIDNLLLESLEKWEAIEGKAKS